MTKSTFLYPARPSVAVESSERLRLDKNCKRCPLHQKASSVCMAPDGKPGGVLLVGEHPGPVEDEQGKPFIGRTGMHLRSLVEDILGREALVVYDNAIRCAPAKTSPDDKEIASCRPYLAEVVARAKPTRIVCMGSAAILAVLGRSLAPFSVRRGFAWLGAPTAEVEDVPVYTLMHPTAGLRNEFVGQWFENDLRWALTEEPPFAPPWTTTYETVRDRAAVASAVAALLSTNGFAFDVETFGRRFTPHFRLLNLSACAIGAKHVYVWDSDSLADPELLQPLRFLLQDPRVPKYGHNVKFDAIAVAEALKFDVMGIEGDTQLWLKMLESDAESKLRVAAERVGLGGHKAENKTATQEAAKLIHKVHGRRKNAGELQQKKLAQAEDKVRKKFAKEEDKKKKQGDLQALFRATDELGLQRALKKAREEVLAERDTILLEAERELFDLHDGEDKDQHERDLAVCFMGLDAGDEVEKYSMAWVPRKVRSRYNALDSLSTSWLAELYQGRMRNEGHVHRFYNTVVRQAIPALAQVERWGMPVSRDAIQTFGKKLEVDLEEVTTAMAGFGSFNPNSIQDLQRLLFEQLKLPVKDRTETGQPSTAADVLEAMKGEHPVIPLILRHRKLSKMLGTYVKQLLGAISPDERIHPSFRIDGAETGRLSCVEPNLQNIPSPTTALGRMARSMFCARPGWSLVELDFSQLELRVAAALSGDPKMRVIFTSGQDYHLRTAQMIARTAWGKDPSQITEDGEERRAAKIVNFGVLYGMEDRTLSEGIGCTPEEAGRVREALFGEFSYLAEWIQKQLWTARRTGFAYTYWWYDSGSDPILARKRNLWRIKDHDKSARITAEHGSWNTPVQGTASDLCLDSLWKAVDWIYSSGFPGELGLTIHDALMFHVPEGYEDETVCEVSNIMANRWMSGVPLVVDAKVGKSWGSLQKRKAT